MSEKFRSTIRSFFTKPPLKGRINGKNCGLEDAKMNGWFQQETGDLITGFRIGAEDTVLDVGCGDGGACIFAANQGAEVIAVDILDEAIQRVDRRLANSKARAHRAIVSDANPLPLEDNTATCVMAMEVLEHVDDPAQFLSELVRVGKPQARYLITVPDPVAENVQKRLATPSYWSKPNHLRIFGREELDQAVSEAGLMIESRGYKSFFWAMWWILFWGVEQKVGEPEEPVLANWTATWNELLKSPKGNSVRNALDEFMPKSQYVIARKAA
ncbi:MAG: class I SAM-dependent methyltransferase [Planctomycetaceae bacterium]|nr:class I SAM-dependent methyltransferase [Planctomycetales bacterium]MCB9925182.1 class I SAM-dependent methyltransferase [Planctomycetaceae bacterium]